MIVLRAELSEATLDVSEHEALVNRRAAGAVVSFAGVVRDHDGGRSVTRLEYSAHPSAAAVLAEVAAEVAAVSADHRAAAFRTCALLVDTVKERLPVWKHQFFADGTEEWVGSA